MTSIMQRPRSTQPSDLIYKDNSHSNTRSTSHSHSQSLSNGLTPPTAHHQSGTSSELEDQLANLQRELMGDSNVASSSNMDLRGHHTNSSNYDLTRSSGGGGERDGGEGSGIGGNGEGTSSNMGLLDDPAVMALIEQSGQLDSDFELTLAAQAHSAQLQNDMQGHLSDLDLTSATTFQFPELPASLLDQAPEYEYSLHTQANVFDAVQEYGQGSDDEAGRIFGLDHYDPALLVVHQPGAAVAGENYWNYHDSSGGAGSFHQGQMSDYATFHDSSSLSDYPEPSTAPSSRASDWKQEPATGMFQNSNQNQTSFAPPINYSLKRRRESFDASFNTSHVDMVSAYGRPLEQVHYSMQSQAYPQYADVRQVRDSNQVVPSQSNRTRMTTWSGEGVGHYVDDWPPPPAPAPSAGSTTNFGQRMSNSMFAPEPSHMHNNYQAQHGGRHHPGASNLINNSAVARMRSTSSDGSSGGTAHKNGVSSPRSSHATRTASQNELINAMGNAMDTAMESEGVAKCPYPNCSKTFAKNRSYNLKAHLRSHSQLKPFACNHCPRAFSRKHDLERHARVHSGDKPYICEACGKGFPRSDALRRHWRVEKECGDKAVEIEAGQPLPSLPPGVNTVPAQVKAPVPGMMHSNGPMTTSMSGNNFHYNSFSNSQNWETGADNSHNNFGDSYAYQQPDRKRVRGEY